MTQIPRGARAWVAVLTAPIWWPWQMSLYWYWRIAQRKAYKELYTKKDDSQ